MLHGYKNIESVLKLARMEHDWERTMLFLSKEQDSGFCSPNADSKYMLFIICVSTLLRALSYVTMAIPTMIHLAPLLRTRVLLLWIWAFFF